MEGGGGNEDGSVGGSNNNANGVLYNKRGRPRPLFIAFLCLLSCSLIWVSKALFGFPSTFSLSYGAENEDTNSQLGSNASICSSLSNGTICCDRSSTRTDIRFMKGDIWMLFASFAIFLYTIRNLENFVGDSSSFVEVEQLEEKELKNEKVKPYTRKWETSIMNTIEELNLISKSKNLGFHNKCDVWHDVPAVFLSTGGYTGIVYHEFNDGIIPLYITLQHFNKKVVFVILEYHNWWLMKYGDIVSILSDYQPIDFNGDNRTHPFLEAIVGLRIHDELIVNSSLMDGNRSIIDFRDLLDRAYWPRIRSLIQEEEYEEQQKFQGMLSLPPSSMALTDSEKRKREDQLKKPKLTILSRTGSRNITNEDLLVKLADEIGFWVEVMKPDRTTELARIYRALNSSDVMIGVHGAAMTHFLFLKPGCVFIQVIPLGTEWATETYYGEPAMKLGLKCTRYKILPRESSLYNEYDKDDPALRDPRSVVKRGWEFTKKIYLDNQTVKLDLKRFRKSLVRAYGYSVSRRRSGQAELQL
ncbi:hypothetical protein Ancab_031139 [Ancistrocladus abbreviatus]